MVIHSYVNCFTTMFNYEVKASKWFFYFLFFPFWTESEGTEHSNYTEIKTNYMFTVRMNTAIFGGFLNPVCMAGNEILSLKGALSFPFVHFCYLMTQLKNCILPGDIHAAFWSFGKDGAFYKATWWPIPNWQSDELLLCNMHSLHSPLRERNLEHLF